MLPFAGRAANMVLALALGACGGDGNESEAPPPVRPSRAAVEQAIERAAEGGTPTAADVSYARDIEPIFSRKCSLCHFAGNLIGVDLTHPFDPQVGIVNRPTQHAGAEAKLLVDPTNPANSFLLDKVARDNLVPALEGEPMPWLVPRLDAGQIAAIRSWISGGALDDAAFRSEVRPIFGDGTVAGLAGGRCTHCHNPKGLFEPDLTQPFDPVHGIVNVAGLGGLPRVAPGDPDGSGLVLKIEGDERGGVAMPFHPDRFTLDEVNVLAKWIVAGAPEN